MSSELKSEELRAILVRIERALKETNEKLSILVENSIQGSSAPAPPLLPLDVGTLLRLPDHLRKSAMAVFDLGEATAEQIGRKTGRTRAAESDYLNQLVRDHYLKKTRKSRDVYFSAVE